MFWNFIYTNFIKLNILFVCMLDRANLRNCTVKENLQKPAKSYNGVCEVRILQRFHVGNLPSALTFWEKPSNWNDYDYGLV